MLFSLDHVIRHRRVARKAQEVTQTHREAAQVLQEAHRVTLKKVSK